MDTNYYTINHINKNIYINAHQTSARYARETSEFKQSNLTEEYLNNFYAPFVKESHLKLGIAFKEKIDIKINGTSLIIGEITDIHIPTDSILEDGFIDIEKAGTIASSGLDSYHTTTKLARLSYAKPTEWPSNI